MRRNIKSEITALSATLPELTSSQCEHIISCLQSEGESGTSYYYGIYTTCKGWQVIRHYMVARYGRKGAECNYMMVEVYQNWIFTDGTQAVMARPCKSSMWYYDLWDYSRPMTYQKMPTNVYSRPYRRYHNNDSWTNPHVNYIPELRRNGYSVKYAQRCYSVDLFMSLILSDNRIETLIKAGQCELAMFAIDNASRLDRYWPQMRIAMRHGYIVTDTSLWTDTINFIGQCGGDTHNPKYICPSDLNATHNTWQKRLEGKRVKERIGREREHALSQEEKYEHMYGKYLDIVIEEGGFVIRPLQSVMEFLQEGEEMHHCVYTGGYYNKEHCLILSCRDEEGNRISTIEMNLQNFEVVQNRSKCNGIPEQKEEIEHIISTHRYVFAKAKHRKNTYITSKRAA